MAFLGAPDTRPDKDYCIINGYPQLDRAHKDWEATALIAWVLHDTVETDDKVVSEVLHHHFGLHRDEQTVSLHHPETFLIKFVSKRTRDRVRDAKKFHHKALEIHVRPWRMVSHALRAAMFYRVRLCLEGLPVFVWTTDIAERIIGRKCSLHSLKEVSMSHEDTRTFNLWACTANPRTIAKAA